MPIFKMLKGALPPEAVGQARTLAEGVGRRTGAEKFSIASERTNADERRLGLEVVAAFLDGPAATVFRDRFGVEPAVCLNITTVRHQAVSGREKPVGWHLDLGFAGDGAPFLVAWTALQDVGTARPGLEVCIPTRGTLDVASFMQEWHARRGRGASMQFSDGDLDDHLGAAAWAARPTHAEAGDAAVFDQFVLHRTQVLAEGYAERHSVEFRMTDIDNLPIVQRTQPSVFARRDAGSLGIAVVAGGHRQPLTIEQFAGFEFRSATPAYS